MCLKAMLRTSSRRDSIRPASRCCPRRRSDKWAARGVRPLISFTRVPGIGRRLAKQAFTTKWYNYRVHSHHNNHDPHGQLRQTDGLTTTGKIAQFYNNGRKEKWTHQVFVVHTIHFVIITSRQKTRNRLSGGGFPAMHSPSGPSFICPSVFIQESFLPQSGSPVHSPSTRVSLSYPYPVHPRKNLSAIHPIITVNAVI